MAKLLFPLRYVPDSEAQAIRELLDENGIEWYETTAGNWGISVAAIWLKNDAQWEKARACIDAFQHRLGEQSREAYRQQVEQGEAVSVLGLFLRNPFIYLLALAGTALILYFSIKPFVDLARQ